jgi:hypothetical protein
MQVSYLAIVDVKMSASPCATGVRVSARHGNDDRTLAPLLVWKLAMGGEVWINLNLKNEPPSGGERQVHFGITAAPQ